MTTTRILTSLLFFGLATVAQAATSLIELKYSGFSFSVPDNMVAIGSNGGRDNFLVLRYGPEKGKRYLAFTDMTNESSVMYQCDPATFYSHVFGVIKNSDCNRVQLASFRDIFLSENNYEVWQSGDTTGVFVRASGMNYVFLLGDKGRVAKVDSDFLPKEQLRRVVGL
ncbi:MAG: hypothetical protein R3208_16885 [Ketobacteraceae bacterium]|nr:hypothetical protein [Ketobacteraceae bacterium]